MTKMKPKAIAIIQEQLGITLDEARAAYRRMSTMEKAEFIRLAQLAHISVTETACCYCHLPFTLKRRKTRDHVIPKSLGGTLIGAACSPCNTDKADKLLTEWYAELHEAGDPRAAIVGEIIVRCPGIVFASHAARQAAGDRHG